MNGQTNFTVNQMNAEKLITWATSVRLRFMRPPQNLLSERGGEWIREGEEHRDAQADDERCVDESQEQEHLALQRVGELGLARRRFEEAAAHPADAEEGGAEGTGKSGRGRHPEQEEQKLARVHVAEEPQRVR